MFSGGVAEWFNAPVSKTGIPQGIEGSNPSTSAQLAKNRIFAILYRLWPYRLTVRTPAFQAVNPGSIPGRVTN